MSVILCIDDTPDETIDTSLGTTLEQILKTIFKNSPYNLDVEPLGDRGIEKAKNDCNVKLVLLDVEFKRQKMQGDEIVKELQKVRPELKVIVLTRKTETGKKISFGHKTNVVSYVIKREIYSPYIQSKLKNLSQSIIEDYENQSWKLEHDEGFTALTLSKNDESFGINIPPIGQQVIKDCIKFPNKPVNLSDISVLNKAHNLINKNVLEGTNWKTWGVLDKEGCAKGQLKLVIGSATSSSSSPSPKDHYVAQSQFETFTKEINSRLDKIEQLLGNILTPDNKTKG